VDHYGTGKGGVAVSTATTPKFFAVGDFCGPVSVAINAESAAAAAEWFNGQSTNFADAGRTDAEDALEICGDGMSSEEFASELEARGYTVASGDLCDDGNWVLWAKG
jgi:hypothetical protein